MTTPPTSQHLLRSNEALFEDDLLGIYQKLQDIAETVMLPNDENKIAQNIDDNNFGEIEGFYKEIDHKEKQIKVLVEISTSLLTKTKEKIINKEQEIKFIEQNVDILENDLGQGRERIAESNEVINSLNNQKNQLEAYLNDLENGYEKTQENLFRSQEEFISLGEYKRKFQELNSLLDQNNDLLCFYKQTNEDLRREYKYSKSELSSSKLEVESMRKKLTSLLEGYEKSICKQTNLNKQKLFLQDHISKIKEDIKNMQQQNSVLIKEIEQDQLKRIRGVTKINSVGFLQAAKDTPKATFLTNLNPNPQKAENFDDKMSIDLLIENEEKSQENLRTPQLVKKCENFEEKDKKLNENLKTDENKTNDFNYENFTSFKNSLEINVISQKSEEFTKEADGSKFFKPGNKLNNPNKNNQNNVDYWGGLMNFWMVGGITVLFSVILIIKAQAKTK